MIGIWPQMQAEQEAKVKREYFNNDKTYNQDREHTESEDRSQQETRNIEQMEESRKERRREMS